MSAGMVPVGYTNGTSFKWNTPGQVIAAATVLPALGLIGVVLRFWSRLHRGTGFGLDDAFIIPALLCVIGLSITLLVGVSKNAVAYTTPPNSNAASADAQLYQITPQQNLVEEILFIFLTISVLAYGFIKLSVLFFYRRLFVNGASTTFDIASKVAIGITSIWTLAFFLTQLFSCGRHVDWNWGPLINQTRCLNGLAYTDALYVSDSITDLLVICLPIPIILRLHMTMQRRIETIGVLLLGTMSIVASVVRIVYGFQIQADGLTEQTDVDGTFPSSLFLPQVPTN
ncbi:MAG: hypothetical protein ASARMPRED_002520 [Alectoria sarmentosa]|nr:MAG: hypothetical protein ASARMPRED_002520 [Alectoria sarmentosa]